MIAPLIRALDAGGLFWGHAKIGEPVSLFEQEQAAITKARPHRRAEFAAGRLAAQRALRAAGRDPAPILKAPDRSPVWPDALYGSLTHAGGYAICVLSETSALGLDLEEDRRSDPTLALQICYPGDHGDPLAVFSAKEAVYKAIYPQAPVLFGFDGMRVDLTTGQARLVRTPETTHLPPQIFDQPWPVRQIRQDGWILSLCASDPRM